MLLGFWVLWRLRGLSWRETFATVRWLITGAVRRATAVMGLYLRSFEATSLIYRAEMPSVFATNDDAALPRRLQETSATHQERRGRFAHETRRTKSLSLPLQRRLERVGQAFVLSISD